MEACKDPLETLDSFPELASLQMNNSFQKKVLNADEVSGHIR